jgi:hypothetical protein
MWSKYKSSANSSQESIKPKEMLKDLEIFQITAKQLLKDQNRNTISQKDFGTQVHAESYTQKSSQERYLDSYRDPVQEVMLKTKIRKKSLAPIINQKAKVGLVLY